MPKEATSCRSKATVYEREFPKEFCKNPNGELFCKLCCTIVNCDKRFRVDSHRSSKKHKKLLPATTSGASTSRQSFIAVPKKTFKGKLVEAFLSADIPLYKLQNEKIKELFTSLGQPVPSESNCRAHVSELAEEGIKVLEERFRGKKIFIVADESEIDGSKYFNILIGDISVPEKTYVLDCSIVETMNQQVVTTKIDDALKKLNIERNNFVLLVSDAARYMTACTNTLKTLFPQLFHITCLAHMLHNCAEKVRGHFAEVDNLIAAVKAVTVKNKQRRHKFNEIGSPPQPVLTRWGTWLNAVEYYAKHLVEVRNIVNSFEGNGVLVLRAKAAVNDWKVRESLVKIQRDYQVLPQLIKRMENSKYTIKAAYEDITKIDLKEDCAKIGSYIRKRMEKNSDISNIVNLRKDGVSPATYAQIQNCQPTSASVERSFSMLRKLLRKDRSFLPENVEKYLSSYYNKL